MSEKNLFAQMDQGADSVKTAEIDAAAERRASAEAIRQNEVAARLLDAMTGGNHFEGRHNPSRPFARERGMLTYSETGSVDSTTTYHSQIAEGVRHDLAVSVSGQLSEEGFSGMFEGHVTSKKGDSTSKSDAFPMYEVTADTIVDREFHNGSKSFKLAPGSARYFMYKPETDGSVSKVELNPDNPKEMAELYGMAGNARFTEEPSADLIAS